MKSKLSWFFNNFKKVFFENIGVRQIIFKNTFWLTAAEIVTGLLRFALLVFATRILGAIEYGKFTFAFSFVSIMVICSDLGVINIAIRELSRSRKKENEFSEFLSLDVVLSGIALVLMIGGSFLVTSNPDIRKIIWFLAVFILITSFYGIFYSFLRSRQKMEYEAVTKILQSLTTVAIAFFAVSYFRSALGLVYGYLFANIVSMVLFLVFFHFYFQPLKLRWNKKIFEILKVSWPMSLGFINSWIYMTTTSVMLGYFNLIAQNGWYSAASKIVILATMPASLIVGSFYPVASNLFINSREKIQKSFNHLMAIMIFLSVPITIGGIALAPKIIHLLYGFGFIPSIFILQLLMPLIVISFIGYPYSVALVIADQQKKIFNLILIGIGINIALNFMLIPLYGLYGAVTSLMISSMVVLFLTIITLKYLTRIPITFFNAGFFKNIAVACISALIMFFAITQPIIYNFNIFIPFILGCACYSLIFFILKKWLNFINT